MNRPLAIAAGVVPVVVFLAVYGAHAGHGFLGDDFGWILQSRTRSVTDVFALFSTDSGSYRPVASLSFTVNEWMFGAHPLGYGLTNVLFALACAAAIVYLARSCALSTGASIFAGLLWLTSLHFTNAAVLCISGRTALLVTLAAVLTVASVMRGRPVLALFLLAVALLAGEEAVFLPVAVLVLLIVWRRLTGRSPVSISVWIAGSIAIVGVYLAARSFTQAVTPTTTFSHTFAPTAVLVTGVVICLSVAAVVGRIWETSTPRRRQWALVAAVLLGLILTPVYWFRANRLTTQADFSTAMLDDLERLLKPIPAKSRIVVYDVAPGGPDRVATLESTVGGYISQAYELRTGRRMDLVLVATAARAADGSIPIEATGFLPLVVQDGRLRFASPGAAK